MSKFDMLIDNLYALLEDKEEILLRGYDLSGLINSLEKHEA